MTKFRQIVLLIVAVLVLEANGKPLFQGISFQRGFELNFKPLPRNPITFIKEKWSPFGVFGRKHSLQKRNSGSGDVAVGQAAPVVTSFSGLPEPRPAAPVFEHVEETGHLHTPPLVTLPHQSPRSVVPLLISSPVPAVSLLQPQLISPGPPIVSSPPPMPLTVIVTPAPRPISNYMPPPPIPEVMEVIPPKQPITSDVQPPPPFRMDGSLPPLSSNMVVPPPPELYTDVSRAEPVREYVNSVQPIPSPIPIDENAAPSLETNSVSPEPPKNGVVPNENPLIRGSKLALYFGSIFLQLMSTFMTNARATFDQMSNGPPVFNN